MLDAWPLTKKAFQDKGSLIQETEVSLLLGTLLLVHGGQALDRLS